MLSGISPWPSGIEIWRRGGHGVFIAEIVYNWNKINLSESEWGLGGLEKFLLE